MKTSEQKFKLNDNVEFLERPVKNWRYGKIVEIISSKPNSSKTIYKIYSGTDMFLAQTVKYGEKMLLESI